MKVYIAGPMTGIPEFNYPAFDAAQADLVAAGYEVESPAAAGQVHWWGWEEYMRRGLAELLRCQAVALLPGWEGSKGTLVEVGVAETLRMWVFPLGEFLGGPASRTAPVKAGGTRLAPGVTDETSAFAGRSLTGPAFGFEDVRGVPLDVGDTWVESYRGGASPDALLAANPPIGGGRPVRGELMVGPAALQDSLQDSLQAGSGARAAQVRDRAAE